MFGQINMSIYNFCLTDKNSFMVQIWFFFLFWKQPSLTMSHGYIKIANSCCFSHKQPIVLLFFPLKISLQCARIPFWIKQWLELLPLLWEWKLGLLGVVESLKGGSLENQNSLTNTYMKLVGKVSIHPSLSPLHGWSSKIWILWGAYSRNKGSNVSLNSLKTFIQIWWRYFTLTFNLMVTHSFLMWKV